MSINLDFIKTHKVREVMSTPVICAGENATAQEVFDQLATNHQSGIPIVDEGHHVIGIITRLDLLKEVQKGTELKTVTAKQIMTHNIITADVNSLVVATVRKFLDCGVNLLPVTDQGKLVGIISRYDVLCHLVEHQPQIFTI